MSPHHCQACFGTNLVVADGLVYCSDCGTQAQEVIEEQEVAETGAQQRTWRTTAGSNVGNVTAAQRRAATAAAAVEAGDVADASQGFRSVPPAEQLVLVQEATVAYVRGLTRMIKAQVQLLVEQMHVRPQVEELVQQLWLAHLPLTGILEPDFWKQGRPCAATMPKMKPYRGRYKMAGWAQAAGGAAAAEAAAGAAELCEPEAADGDEPAPEAAAAGDLVDREKEEEEEEEEVQYVMIGRGGRKEREPRFISALKLGSIWHKALPHHLTLTICYLACYYYREAVLPGDIIAWALSGRLPFMDAPTRCEDLYQGLYLAHAVRYGLLPLKQAFPDAGLMMHVAQSLAHAHGLPLPGLNAQALMYRMVRDLAMPEVLYHAALEICKVHLLLTPLLSIQPTAAGQSVNPYASLAAALLMAAKLLYGLDGQRRQLLPGVPPAPPWLDWAQRVISMCPDPSDQASSYDQVCKFAPAALDQYLQFCEQGVFAAGKPVELLQECQPMFAQLLRQLQQPQQPGDAAPMQQQGQAQQQAGEVLLVASPVLQSPDGGDQEQQQATDDKAGASSAAAATATTTSYYLSASSMSDRTMHADYTAVLCACSAYIGVRPAALDAILGTLEASAMQAESGVALTLGLPEPNKTNGDQDDEVQLVQDEQAMEDSGDSENDAGSED